MSASSRRDPTRGAAQGAVVRVAVAVTALLLFLWPLVRAPRLPLLDAAAHLFAAWALLIVALFVMHRPATRAAREPDPSDRSS
jgi:hypothetical protein